MNSAIIAVITITTKVEPNTSCLVDHDTLPNSALTSFKKFIGFANMLI